MNHLKTPPAGRFVFDFRHLTFTGPARYSLATLIICCVFLLSFVWLIKLYILPLFATAAGSTVVKNLGKLVTIFKGAKSP